MTRFEIKTETDCKCGSVEIYIKQGLVVCRNCGTPMTGYLEVVEE